MVVTDQERPDLVNAIPVTEMSARLAQHNTIVTALIRYAIATPDNNRAIGIQSDGRQILPTRSRRAVNSSFAGEATRQRLMRDYIGLARRSGGSVFDLDMLRVESAADLLQRDPLVSEISDQVMQQLNSRCEQCICNDNTISCTDLTSTVRQYCLQPQGKKSYVESW